MSFTPTAGVYLLLLTLSGWLLPGLVNESSPRPESVDLQIERVFPDNCRDDRFGGSLVDWQLDISVTMPPDNDLSFQRNSEAILTHTLTGITDTLTIENVPADNFYYDTLKVWFTNDPTVGDTLIVPRPNGCSTCSCREYIYLNEKSFGGAVHKFEVRPDTLLEVGSPWFDNTAAGDDLTSPHGLGNDLNGNLYIGETTGGDIRRFSCDGTIADAMDFAISDGGYNFGVVENTLFVNSESRLPNGIYAYDLCTQAEVGYLCLNGIVSTNYKDWGFYVDANETFFVTDNYLSSHANHLWKFKLDTVTINPIGGGSPMCIEPFLDEGDGTLVPGEKELPRFSLYGVVTDAWDNIYIVEKARSGDPGFSGSGLTQRASRVLKYRPDGSFVAASVWDNNDGDGGYFNAIGIVYSEVTNQLYVSTESPADDCVSVFDTSLTYLGPGVPATGAATNVKGIAITRECCPTPENWTIDTTFCGAAVQGDTLFLNNFFNCDGLICEGTWSQAMGGEGITFLDCNNSIVMDSAAACGTFTLASDGMGSNVQCGAFTLTLNIESLDAATPVITNSQEICAGTSPDTLYSIVNGSPVGGRTYQWQSSTMGCSGPFIDLPGGTNDRLAPKMIGDTMYYRLIVNDAGSCSSGLCSDTSNCVVVNTFACDFGDLPDPLAGTASGDYHTRAASDGPTHRVTTQLFLGITVDAETTALVNATATGDDSLDGSDDEDGLGIAGFLDLHPGRPFQLPLSYANTSGDTAFLRLWIDWNGDGDFADDDESVFDNFDLTQGLFESISGIVPANAIPDQPLGVRLRIGDRANMSPQQYGGIGEVEDYTVTVRCPDSCLPTQAIINRMD